jgi:GNAT superfamily N-acetyltransferase
MLNGNATIPLKFLVRPAVPVDNFGIRKVQVDTWKTTYHGMIPDHILDQMTVDGPPPKRLPNIDSALMESRRTFVAEDSHGAIIGFVVGGLPRNSEWGYQCELWAMYVLKANQGTGVGKSLFEALKQELARSYENMIVWSLEANLRSHQFYDRRGGRPLPLRKPFKWEDAPIAMELAYAWDRL